MTELTPEYLLGLVRGVLEALGIWQWISASFTAMLIISLVSFLIRMFRGN